MKRNIFLVFFKITVEKYFLENKILSKVSWLEFFYLWGTRNNHYSVKIGELFFLKKLKKLKNISFIYVSYYI
jgi:hypothetical protein